MHAFLEKNDCNVYTTTQERAICVELTRVIKRRLQCFTTNVVCRMTVGYSVATLQMLRDNNLELFGVEQQSIET